MMATYAGTTPLKKGCQFDTPADLSPSLDKQTIVLVSKRFVDITAIYLF